MSYATNLTNWAQAHSAKKAERWEKRQAQTSTMLQSWRTPQRQKLLISLYFANLALGLAVVIGQLFWPPLLLAWLLTTLFLIVIWTMLRITIDSKDDAPPEVLDEYEESVLNNWRRIAFNSLVWLGTIGFGALVFFSVAAIDSEEILGFKPMLLVYSGALIGLLIFLAIAALPAVGYAMTFGIQAEHDEDEVAST